MVRNPTPFPPFLRTASNQKEDALHNEFEFRTYVSCDICNYINVYTNCNVNGMMCIYSALVNLILVSIKYCENLSV